MWYEKFEFKDDPYVIRSPMVVPFEQIRWNRNDLADKESLHKFIERVLDARRVGMRVYGPAGSGKTWLLRYIEKKLTENSKAEAMVLYTYAYIPGLEPTFSVFYEKFISEIEPHLLKILEPINKKADGKQQNWINFFDDKDLANALYNICTEDKKADDYKAWLFGIRMSSADLHKIEIKSSLVGDYRKFKVMRTLIEKSLLAFSSFTLIVDELENAPPSLAKGLGDSLRDLLDSFYDRFSLVCGYTTEIADEIIDWGYGEFLYRRLEHEVKMERLTWINAIEFLRIHHECYRKANCKVEDQLLPFEESGLKQLIEIMDPKHCYPRYILTNCGVLAEQAAKEKVNVTSKFVINNKFFLSYLA